MNGSQPNFESIAAGPFHDRIGPIFDPAFLKLIPREVLKEITVIRAKALQSTIQAELSAADQVVKTLDKVRFEKAAP